jgi:hypothetical protein
MIKTLAGIYNRFARFNPLDKLFLTYLFVVSLALLKGFVLNIQGHNIVFAFAFLSNLLLIGVLAFYVHYFQYKSDYKKILTFVLTFNIIILLVKAIFFDFYTVAFPPNFFKSAYLFGNFADFFVLFDPDLIKNSGLSETGYLPFSLFVFKLFSFVHQIHSPFNIFFYNLLFFGAYLFVIKFFLRKYNPNINKYFIYLFILCSYIFSFSYERGNPSFLSFLIFSILFFHIFQNRNITYFNDNRVAFLASLLISIKILNIIFLYPIFRSFNKRFLFKIILFAIPLNLLLAIFLVGFDPIQILGLLRKAFFSPISNVGAFSDANSVLGTSSYNSLYIAFKNIFAQFSEDAISVPNIYRLYMLLIGFLLFIFYTITSKKDIIFDSILIILIPLFFHTSNGDYNLQMLIPIVLCICVSKSGLYFNILKYLLILCMLINYFPFAFIYCCGVIGRVNSITLKPFIFPSVILLSILYIVFASNLRQRVYKFNNLLSNFK